MRNLSEAMKFLRIGAFSSSYEGLLKGYERAGFVYEHKELGGVAFREHQLKTFVAGNPRDPARDSPIGLENIFSQTSERVLSGQILVVEAEHDKGTNPIISENYNRFRILERQRQ